MPTPLDSELIAKSIQEADLFPGNIVISSTPGYQLESYLKRLGDEATKIFCKEGESKLHILEYDDHAKGTW
jgi:hypothetical protein